MSGLACIPLNRNPACVHFLRALPVKPFLCGPVTGLPLITTHLSLGMMQPTILITHPSFLDSGSFGTVHRGPVLKPPEPCLGFTQNTVAKPQCHCNHQPLPWPQAITLWSVLSAYCLLCRLLTPATWLMLLLPLGDLLSSLSSPNPPPSLGSQHSIPTFSGKLYDHAGPPWDFLPSRT